MSPTSSRSASSRQGLYILLLVAAVILVGFFLVWPKFSQWKTTKDNFATTSTNLTERQENFKRIEVLVSNYKSKKQQLQILEQTLPSSPAVPQLLANLERLVTSVGMKLDAVTVTEDTQSSESTGGTPAKKSQSSGSALNLQKLELVDLKVNLNVSGQYSDFYKLLEVLQLNQRLYEVDTISVQQSAKSGDQDSGIAFNLLILTKYQK
ncbi:MAG: hypothetical protein Q8N81_00305 [bacterium]|nr:hypothetical protein [bacterium]